MVSIGQQVLIGSTRVDVHVKQVNFINANDSAFFSELALAA